MEILQQLRDLFLKLPQLKRIDQDTGDDDQVSHDFPSRDLFLQNEMREKQDKHIGSSINDRTIAHIYFCITPRIEKEDQHIYGV